LSLTNQYEKIHIILNNFNLENEIPKNVLHYLNQKHQTILDDYVESCSLIAVEIAKLFVKA